MKTADIQELSNFLLDYAAMLMRSGANTERTVRNVLFKTQKILLKDAHQLSSRCRPI